MVLTKTPAGFSSEVIESAVAAEAVASGDEIFGGRVSDHLPQATTQLNCIIRVVFCSVL